MIDPFRCPECGEVKVSIPHNDWGRTCFGEFPKSKEVEEDSIFRFMGSDPEPVPNMEEPVLDDDEEPVLPTFKI